MNSRKDTLMTWIQTALMAALCYVTFTFLQIKIPLPCGDAVSIHIGNAVCVLAALLLGGVYGGIAGAVGMGIADVFDPVYLTVAPKTVFLKFFIGLITGYVAHHIARINEHEEPGYWLKWSVIASACGLGFNVIFDPLVGYFYKMYVLGQPQEVSALLAKYSGGVTFINAVISTVLVAAVYQVLRPALGKSGLLTLQGSSGQNRKVSQL